MKIIVTESQLNEVINMLSEGNDYYDYNNVSDAQKQEFYRNKSGYGQIPVNNPKKKVKYVDVWEWKSGDMSKFPESWHIVKTFPKWAFAQKWIDKYVYPNNKKYYKIVPVYE